MDEDNVETMPWTKTNTEVEEFILWKKDNAPDAKDPRISAIHNWIDISQVVNEGYDIYTNTLFNSDFNFMLDSYLDSFTFTIIVDKIICIINTIKKKKK